MARLLKVDLAYHSSYMEAIASEYQGLIAGVSPRGQERDISLPSFFFTVYSRKVAPAELSKAKYWVDNIFSPIHFAETMLLWTGGQELGGPKQITLSCLLKIGPHAALKGPIREITLLNPTLVRS